MTSAPEKTLPAQEKAPEIKTPEELITRLEAKSEKNLAMRVRNIKKTVTGGTELDWKQLQSELSPAEKQKIEDVLKAEDPEVGNRLKTVAEVATGVAVVGGAVAVTTKDKKENTNKMKEWFKEGKEKRVFLKESMLAAAKKSGGELDLGEKIMINIMAFMAPLIPEGMLGWLADFGILPEGMADGLKEWENGVRVFKDKVEGVKGKVEEKGKEIVGEHKETIKAVAYTGMISYLSYRENKQHFNSWWDAVVKSGKDHIWGKDKRIAQEKSIALSVQLLEHSKIKDKSFSELMKIEKLSTIFPDATEEQELSWKLSRTLLEKNEKWIEVNLAHNKDIASNWKDSPIKDILSGLYKGIGYEKIDIIKKGIQNVDLTRPLDAMKSFSTILWHKKSDGTEDGILKENIAVLREQGLSDDLLLKCFVNPDGEGKQTVAEYRGHGNIQEFKSEKTRDFVDNLVKKGGFGTTMIKMMSDMKLGDYSDKFANGEGFTMQQILEVYILTKGETDPNKLNQGTKATLYMLLSGYIIAKDPGTESMERFLKFMNEPDGPIMTDIKDIVSSVFDNATYKAVGMSIGITEAGMNAIIALAKDKPALFASIMFAIAVIAFATWRYTKFIVMIGVFTGFISNITNIGKDVLLGAK